METLGERKKKREKSSKGRDVMTEDEDEFKKRGRIISVLAA